MNILFITTWDAYGIQFNGYLLMKWLNRHGYHADMLVWQKDLDEPNIYRASTNFRRALDRYLVKFEEILSSKECSQQA